MNEKYKQGKIYTIRCKTNLSLIYAGSTIQKYLSQRMGDHRKGKYLTSIQKLITKHFNGDWSNFYIELYESYPCNSKLELERKEGEVIRLIGTINEVIAGRTKPEWYTEHPEYEKTHKNYV